MKKDMRARARRTGAQAAESGAARPAGGAGKTLRALGFAQKLTLAMLLVLAMALSLVLQLHRMPAAHGSSEKGLGLLK